MKKLAFSLLAICLSSFIFAQNNVSEEYFYETPKEEESKTSISDLEIEDEVLPTRKEKKMNFGLELGTTFGSNSAFGTYVSPFLEYHVTPKFSISAGYTHLQQNNANLYQFTNEGIKKREYDLTSNEFFVEGAYKLSDKLTVTGSVMFVKNEFSIPSLNPRALPQDGIRASVGFQYKVNDSFKIEVQVSQEKGNSPFNNRMGGGFYSPRFGF